MDKKHKLISLAMMLTLLVSVRVFSAVPMVPTTVTTAEIIAHGTVSMVNPTCLSWCFTGTCVWLQCSGPFCSVRSSPRYKHFNPDLLVTVYDEIGKDPWIEMNAWYTPFQLTMSNTILGWLTPISLTGGGHQTEASPAQDLEDKSLRFKEGSAYGHPMSALSSFLGGYALCPSEATAYFPYFLSGIDAMEWRFGYGEMLNFPYLLPGVRTVGAGGFFQQWGSVFPRTGFLLQKDDPKAGAVVAQRIGNIVTGTPGLHLASSLLGNGYNWTVLPGELIENVPFTGKWQMEKPLPDPMCYVFGANDVVSPLPWSTGRTTDDNGYAYTLWRRYECCRARGSLITIVVANVCM